jgi:ribosomal protein S18 acetylase RimI-like enzyme
VSPPIYRPLADAGEYPLFLSYPTPTSGVGARSRDFMDYVAAGDYVPGRVWVAERDGAIVARAAFWAPPGESLPWGVDYFDPGTGPDRIEVGAALLRAAYDALVPPDYAVPPHPDSGRPDYHLFLPPDWREHADARRDAEDRIAAAARAGLVPFVERLNLRRTLDGLPPRSGRLRFVSTAGRHEELVAVMMRVNESTLDAHVRQDMAREGPRAAVERMLTDALDLPGAADRDWWRLAYTPAGDPVGFVLPVCTSMPTLWYIGVVPEHRGRRYSDDLVTEALHVVSAAGENAMQDSTDIGNALMAASFARCGYTVMGRRIIMT